VSTNLIPFTPRPRDDADTDPDTPGVVVRFGDRAVYTVKEVAELLSLSLGGTYQLVRDGTIPALKLGGRWVVPKKRFHTWLDGLTDDGGPVTTAKDWRR
jgi:excisionase family DNA binding protein